MKRTIGLSLFILLLAGTLLFYSDIRYGLRQASGQFKIMTGAKDLNEFLDDPQYPDSLKSKLHLIAEIRQFAIDSLGLNNSDNYTSMYDQKDSAVLWAVNASLPDKIEPYEWCFPIAGCFPYKGYFKLDLVKEEARKMQNLGYETFVRSVGGWSTLGFFNDPILSNMLKESEGELAELIIHELSHATIFIKDSSEMNEALASVIGDMGALEFLKFRYGLDSDQYNAYKWRLKDNVQLAKIVGDGIERLNKHYNTPLLYSDIRYRTEMRNDIIKEIFCAVDIESFHNPKRFKWMELDQFFPNNAYFALFLTYNDGYDDFKKMFNEEFDGELSFFIRHLKEKYEDLTY